jgi:hypothetical protein
MSLITAEELARGLIIGVFGGAAGLCTVALPGSVLWLLPAGVAVAGCALTVPEVRCEVVKALPALPAPQLPQLTQLLRFRARPELPAVPQAAPPVATPPAPLDQVVAGDNLVETLESTPHRLIIGHTRGGKTTLIHHMATSWAAAGERVLVGDPDAAPGLWPGCEVRGAGDDVAAIGDLLRIVAGEVATRRAQRAQGVRKFEPLHLVIDEAQDVLPVLLGGLELFEDVARRGGKLNIRMTVGVQDKQVKTLGLKGKSELLRNLQVADVLKAPDGRRVAILRDPETGARVTMPIPQLQDPEALITVSKPVSKPVSKTPAVSKPVSNDLLASLLDTPVSSALGRQDTPAPVSMSVSNPLDTDMDTDTPPPGVSMQIGADGGNLTVNIINHPESTAPVSVDGRRRRKGKRLDMRRRRQLAQAAQVDSHKAELQADYAARKAAGGSYRKAYAELGGNGEETRTWWRAAPDPKAVRP